LLSKHRQLKLKLVGRVHSFARRRQRFRQHKAAYWRVVVVFKHHAVFAGIIVVVRISYFAALRFRIRTFAHYRIIQRQSDFFNRILRTYQDISEHHCLTGRDLTDPNVVRVRFWQEPCRRNDFRKYPIFSRYRHFERKQIVGIHAFTGCRQRFRQFKIAQHRIVFVRKRYIICARHHATAFCVIFNRLAAYRNHAGYAR